MQTTLRTLTDDLQALLDLGVSDDPEEIQAFNDTLEGILGAIETKADGYAEVMETYRAYAERLKAEKERIAAMEKRVNASIAQMKDSLKTAMIAIGKKQITTELHTFTLTNAAPALKITDEVPDSYLRIVTTFDVDKERIKKELKEGKQLDFAKLVVSPYVRIR